MSCCTVALQYSPLKSWSTLIEKGSVSRDKKKVKEDKGEGSLGGKRVTQLDIVPAVRYHTPSVLHVFAAMCVRSTNG